MTSVYEDKLLACINRATEQGKDAQPFRDALVAEQVRKRQTGPLAINLRESDYQHHVVEDDYSEESFA